MFLKLFGFGSVFAIEYVCNHVTTTAYLEVVGNGEQARDGSGDRSIIVEKTGQVLGCYAFGLVYLKNKKSLNKPEVQQRYIPLEV